MLLLPHSPLLRLSANGSSQPLLFFLPKGRSTTSRLRKKYSRAPCILPKLLKQFCSSVKIVHIPIFLQSVRLRKLHPWLRTLVCNSKIRLVFPKVIKCSETSNYLTVAIFQIKSADRRVPCHDTLIISVRWDSGSRPAIGKIRIFWVFEHLSARDSVIFLWVALSVECGLLKNYCCVRYLKECIRF